jgi:hypothetical protein
MNIGLEERGTSNKRDYLAMALSQVCSLWRAAALSLQPLWDHLEWSSLGPPLANIMIERSGKRPLDILLSMGNHDKAITYMTRDVLARTSRIQLRDCPGRLRHIQDLFRPGGSVLPCFSAPVLKFLTVSSATNVVTRLTEGFLIDTAPSLQKAALRGVELRWGRVDFLRHVQELYIDDSEVTGPFADMRSTLATMINLRKLRLYLKSSPALGDINGEISLPHLEELQLSARLEAHPWAGMLLSVLFAPKLTRCAVETGRTEDSNFHLYQTFLRRFKESLRRRKIELCGLDLEPNCIRAWGITGSEGQTTCFEKVRNDCHTGGNHNLKPIIEFCNVSLIGGATPRWEFLRTICESLDLTCVSDLTVKSYTDPVLADIWRDLSLLLTALSSLSLEESRVLRHELYFLHENYPPPFFASDCQSGPYFPLLATLHLYRITNIESIEIIPWLRFRHGLGMTPQKIVIRGPREPKLGMTKLAGLVQHAFFELQADPPRKLVDGSIINKPDGDNCCIA